MADPSVQSTISRFHGQWPDAVQAPMGGTLAYKRGVICDAEANSGPTNHSKRAAFQ